MSEDLIALGESSTHPFVSEVRKVRGKLDTMVERLSLGEIGSMEDRRFSRVLRPLEWTNKPKGIGYVASSLDFKREMEVFWAAAVVSAFEANDDVDFRPLVIPVDMFYSFLPGNPSLVTKTTYFSSHGVYDEKGKAYALVLSDFTGSEVFGQQVLDDVPHQDDVGYSKSKTGKGFNQFVRTIPTMLEKERDVVKVLRNLEKYVPPEDARLALVSSLLLYDKQSWQDLWYERREGVPLFVVAPGSFHRAMDRLNFSWGHGSRDYTYRSSCSFGAAYNPVFDVIDGKVTYEDDFLKEWEEMDIETRYKRDFKGVSREEFQRRVGPLVEKYENREGDF